MRAMILALSMLLPHSAEAAGPPHLLYLSAEATSQSNYGGIGWMYAMNGLDGSGFIAALDAGRPLNGEERIGGMAGWRLVFWRIYATAMIGVDYGEIPRPAADIDLWWDQGGWMASARGDWTQGLQPTLRASAGYRIKNGLPFLGPEISHTWQGTRFGLHATGIQLPHKLEARLSAGGYQAGGYLELSLWRRF